MFCLVQCDVLPLGSVCPLCLFLTENSVCPSGERVVQLNLIFSCSSINNIWFLHCLSHWRHSLPFKHLASRLCRSVFVFKPQFAHSPIKTARNAAAFNAPWPNYNRIRLLLGNPAEQLFLSLALFIGERTQNRRHSLARFRLRICFFSRQTDQTHWNGDFYYFVAVESLAAASLAAIY